MRGMTQKELIKRIERFASKNGMTPSAVTKRAVDNHRLYGNLVSGKSCTLTVAEKVIAFMDAFQDKSAA